MLNINSHCRVKNQNTPHDYQWTNKKILQTFLNPWRYSNFSQKPRMCPQLYRMVTAVVGRWRHCWHDPKKFKIALKQFLYTHSSYTLEEYLNGTWIMYCVTEFLIALVLILRFYLCTLYKYSLIWRPQAPDQGSMVGGLLSVSPPEEHHERCMFCRRSGNPRMCDRGSVIDS
jgi:hypothetical protein